MSDLNNNDDFGTDNQIPENQPSQDWGTDDFSDVDVDGKVNRGNRGMFIAMLLFLVAGLGVGGFYLKNKMDRDEWMGRLKEASNLQPMENAATAVADILNNSDRLDIQEQAAFELGELKKTQGVSALLKAVPKGGDLSRVAAKSLALIGGDEAKQGADAIFAQMQSAEKLAKAEFAWALCMIGDSRGFGPLLEALGKGIIKPAAMPNWDPDLIARIGTTEKLVEVASSEDRVLRRYSAMELGFRKGPGVVDALLKLVKDDDEMVAKESAISLGRTNDDRAGPALLETMTTKPKLKGDIIKAVARSVGAPGLEIIYKNLDDDADKYNVIGKLKELKDPRSKDLLLTIVNTPVEKYSGVFKPTAEMTEAEKKADAARRQSDNIRNQSLWTLENLGDKRIGPMMMEKVNWEPKTEEQIPDASIRYRQDDMARKIANGVVTWFGKVKPDKAADYLMEIYDANKPFANNSECAQRVKVDIGPLMDAMGRTGDKRFCKIIEPFLDQDEGFYFQAASTSLARLSCDGILKSFLKRMVMTKEERKEKKFSSLLESRDWQMEDRLQERRNSIMSVKFFADPAAAETLMEIVLDPEDDKELRQEAATSLAYCVDEKAMADIIEKVKDEEIDGVVRAALVQGLWFNPNDAAQDAMFEILEGSGTYDLVKPAAIVLGEASNPKNSARLDKLLDHADEQRRRAAAFAIMLSGVTDRLDRVIEILQEQESALVLRDWYEKHPVYITTDMFESKRIFSRLKIAKSISIETAKKMTQQKGEISWPWKYLTQRLKNGWDEGPKGMTKLQIRQSMTDAVRSDDDNRKFAADMLAQMGERGHLLALQSEEGPQALVARDILGSMNSKTK